MQLKSQCERVFFHSQAIKYQHSAGFDDTENPQSSCFVDAIFKMIILSICIKGKKKKLKRCELTHLHLQSGFH